MTPTKHPTNNFTYKAPADWDEAKHGPCVDLPVTRVEENGMRKIQSMWLPDAEELALLLRGKPVILEIYGVSHPVVYVGVAVL